MKRFGRAAEAAESARAHRRNHDFEAAESILHEALLAFPGHDALLTELAEVATARRDWPTAAVRWSEVVALPNQKAPANAFARLSQACRAQGDLVRAEEIANQGLGIYPSHPNLMVELARVGMARKEWQTAIDILDQALAIAPGRAPPNVYAALAKSCRNVGDCDKAEEVLRQGLAVHARNVALLKEGARTAVACKDWTAALARWEQILDGVSDDPAEVYAELARAHRNSGNLSAAATVIDEGLAESPSDVRLLTERAVLENYRPSQLGARIGCSQTSLPTAEIVVCVHNAFEETSRCLEAVNSRTDVEHFVTIIDDASEPEVHSYLQSFVAEAPGRRLFVNDTNFGYTRSANRGLRSARTDWVVLLNSDTLVTRGWLTALLECALSDSAIRAVGPLSNAATFQSLPGAEKLEAAEQIATKVRELSWKICPKVPMLNGFCLMLHRPALEDVGYLDEINFPQGYGEENDLCLRLISAGHKLAIADQAYVHHWRSASFGLEKRQRLTKLGVETLKRLWPGYTYRYVTEVIQEIPALNHLRTSIGA